MMPPPPPPPGALTFVACDELVAAIAAIGLHASYAAAARAHEDAAACATAAGCVVVATSGVASCQAICKDSAAARKHPGINENQATAGCARGAGVVVVCASAAAAAEKGAVGQVLL